METIFKAESHLHILFGTQTGNAETVAELAESKALEKGLSTSVTELNEVTVKDFAKMQFVMIVLSTFGDGEMPDSADLFWDSLSDEKDFKLGSMCYGVLALGDTSHEEFCNAGRLMDSKLEGSGAKKIIDRGDCDYDYEATAEKWIEDFFVKLMSS